MLFCTVSILVSLLEQTTQTEGVRERSVGCRQEYLRAKEEQVTVRWGKLHNENLRN